MHMGQGKHSRTVYPLDDQESVVALYLKMQIVKTSLTINVLRRVPQLPPPQQPLHLTAMCLKLSSRDGPST